jgi:hypothetical protein
MTTDQETNVLDVVEAELLDRQQAADREFQRTAERLASGEKPKAADVEKALTASGRDVADLRREVERLQHRAALKRRIAEADLAEREMQKMTAKIGAATKRLKDFESKVQDEIRPLASELQRLQNVVVAAGSCKQELFADARQDRTTQERLAAVERRQAEIRLEFSALDSQRGRVLQNIDNARADDNVTAEAGARARLAAIDSRTAELQRLAEEAAADGDRIFNEAVEV